MSDLRVHEVVLGEHTLHVNETGDTSAPTILWLHGSGPGVSALSNWRRLITSLVPGHHHVAPDVLGFGDSSHPEDPPQGLAAFAELRADVLLALLDELGLEKVHVVGNSMGGMIALRLLQKAPGRFDRVVLMGSGGAPGAPTPALLRMVGYYADPSPATMRAVITGMIHDIATFGGALDEIAADRAAVADRPGVRRSHLATFDRSAGPPLSFGPEELAALPHETLVIHGREDPVIPVEGSYYLAKHLPNAQLHVIPHAGHWVQIEQPERFAAQAEVFFGEKV